MTYKKNALVLVGMVMVPALWAADISVTLPQGKVACMTRKDAENYASYAIQAPKFAQDLLDRATCFKAVKAEEAVRVGKEKGYVQLKLLSGHTVWVQ